MNMPTVVLLPKVVLGDITLGVRSADRSVPCICGSLETALTE